MFEKYEGTEFSFEINKKKLPINYIYFDNYQEFNRLYKHCQRNFLRVEPTPSQSFPYNGSIKYKFRYMIVKGNQRFEMVVACKEGCFRFVVCNRVIVKNTISGSKAVKEFYKAARDMSVDLTKYAVCPFEGEKIKKEIVSPHIEVLFPLWNGKVIENVFHLDLKSSYASRIVEEYPELRPLYQFLFDKRKEKNELYKHILTNSIGCFQSKFCIDVKDPKLWKTSKYQMAKLSKAAVNGTRKLIEEYIQKLRKRGYIPLLSNTDGIWYYSSNGKPYHDSREGKDLCQWETDHSAEKFLMVGAGAYQFIENGKCESVVRGISNLDSIQPNRELWEFGCIKKIYDVATFIFDEKEGIKKICQV